MRASEHAAPASDATSTCWRCVLRGPRRNNGNARRLLLHLELRIDHILGPLGAAVAGRLWAAAGLLLHELGQRLRGCQQVGVGLADGLYILAAHRLAGLLDRRADRRLAGLVELAFVFLQQLLDLVDRLVRLVASLDDLALATILVGVRFGLLAHPFDFLRIQAAGALDLDLRLL